MHLTPGMAWLSLLATAMLLYFVTIYMLESHHSDIKQRFVLEIRVYKFITSQLHSQQVFFPPQKNRLQQVIILCGKANKLV